MYFKNSYNEDSFIFYKYNTQYQYESFEIGTGLGMVAGYQEVGWPIAPAFLPIVRYRLGKIQTESWIVPGVVVTLNLNYKW